ncbi:MAG: T9SS type A sorting domain-containing protein [Ignavibacteria bacterium]
MKRIITLSIVMLSFCSASFPQTEIWKMQDYSIGQTINSFPPGFQNSTVTMAEVIRLPDGNYRMYFNLQQAGPVIKQCIGYASSADAVHWSYNDTCFCGPLDTTARNYIVGGASVVRLNSGQYRMYYRATQKFSTSPSYHIRSAISNDGINFVQEGIRIDIKPYDINSPFLLAAHGSFWMQSDGTFAAIFSGNPDTSSLMTPSHLIYGTSPDGMNWGNFRVLYQKFHDPKVLKVNGEYIMYAMNLIKYMGKAVSPDGINWPADADSVSFLDTMNFPLIINNTKKIGDIAGVVMPDNEIYLYSNFGTITGPSREIIRFELQNPPTGILPSTNTGTSGTNSESDPVHIYPNPFSDRTSISTNKVLKKSVLTIFNSLGQEVMRINNISGESFTIPRAGLPAGLYFLHLMDEGKIYTHKLIITDK